MHLSTCPLREVSLRVAVLTALSAGIVACSGMTAADATSVAGLHGLLVCAPGSGDAATTLSLFSPTDREGPLKRA